MINEEWSLLINNRFRLFLLFIMLLFCISLFSSTGYSKDRWEWVYSSKIENDFIDYSTIKINKVNTMPEYPTYNSIESVEVWAKVTYNTAGGQQELDLLNVSDAAPDSIYSILRLRLNFTTHTVDIIDGNLYDANGYVLSKYPHRSECDVILNPQYAEIYYYMLGRISQNDEFQQSKNNFYWICSSYNKNGKKFYVYVDKPTIEEKSGHIYCYLFRIGTSPDNDFHDMRIEKADFDLVNGVCHYSSQSVYTNGAWVIRNEPCNITHIFYPDSEIEYIKNRIITFCETNHDWVHRYDKGIRSPYTIKTDDANK